MDMIRWLQTKAQTVSFPIFSTIVFLVALLKTGVAGALPFFPIADAINNFPEPTGGLSGLSMGMRGLAWSVSATTEGEYFLLSLFVTGSAFVLLALAASRSDRPRMSLALIFLGPMGVLLLGNIGRHDALLIIGATVVIASGKRALLVTAGGIVMALANPEQAVVASITFLLMTFTKAFAVYRRTAFIVLTTTSLALTALLLMSNIYPRSSSRADYIVPLIERSYSNFLSNFPLVLYSFLGLLWMVVLGLFLSASLKDRVLISCSLAVPILSTMVTLDQTRVSISVGSLIIILLSLHGARYAYRFLARIGSTKPQLLLGFLLIFSPSIEVTFEGSPRSPFGWLMDQVRRTAI